ncbi:hypothetical protein AQJ30_23850 [Streptomyces longwoodensis]|uniref:Uncharacterized protein n=1 Tax=Streptomyces longwoodensis TaxID=68231 RepID=A0A117QLZ9_9ACTN|nr:hypothetical protein [Streptomyces longwoodensis]KUN35726.1 hypothetical protein AQJ30_23850 [Streptomyces longwoodensis]
MITSSGSGDPQEELTQWLARYRQLRVGDDTWAHPSFADLVIAYGLFFEPAPWLKRGPQRPGQCFAAASHWSDEKGWAYVEGFAAAPAAAPFTVFEHAWCVTDEGDVADPALPDGVATGYFGIPLNSDFRREQQRVRATKAVFTSDPSNPLAGYNERILQQGLPRGALATDVVADGMGRGRCNEGPVRP